MRWREPVSAVSRSEFAAKVRDGSARDNSTSKARDAWIVLKTQFARLACGYWPNLQVRESITRRRRKVISYVYRQSSYSATQGDGCDSGTVACGRFQDPHSERINR